MLETNRYTEGDLMNSKTDTGNTELVLTAAVVVRTRELIADGWAKGHLNTGRKSIETFCVHGAMNLAFQELFPERKEECGRVNVCAGGAATRQGFGAVEAIATAILVDEAHSQFGYSADAWKAGQMGVAPFNDDEARTHEQVLSVLDRTADRLWAMSMEQDDEPVQLTRSWAESDSEENCGRIEIQ